MTYPCLDPDGDYLTLRGVALRGEFVASAEGELPHGYDLTATGVPLRSIAQGRDELIGDAALTLVDGDLHVEARVHADRVARLTARGFLAVALRVVGDEPAAVTFVFPTERADDPLQLPYRLTHVPTALANHPVVLDYDRVRVVDEAHEASLGLNDDGRLQAFFDPDRSHLEWRSSREVDRRSLPDAVARALDYATWVELEHDGTDRERDRAHRVLREVAQFVY